MPLPQSKHQLVKITIPSTNKTYNFRRFLGGEEKILLIAQESGNYDEILRAIEQIIVNCSVDDKFNSDDLTTFDFDYVFIKLRAFSVDNNVSLTFTDNITDEQHNININLDDVKVVLPDISNTVVNPDGVTIVLRYPTMKEMLEIIDRTKQDSDFKSYDFLLTKCVSKIYDKQEVFEFTDEELITFYDDQVVQVTQKIREFLTNVPDVTHVVEYQTAEGEQKQLVLKGIEDFFTFR